MSSSSSAGPGAVRVAPGCSREVDIVTLRGRASVPGIHITRPGSE